MRSYAGPTAEKYAFVFETLDSAQRAAIGWSGIHWTDPHMRNRHLEEQLNNKTRPCAGGRTATEIMSRLRISLFGLVAACMASMCMTAIASAEGPYWHTAGAKLKQGSIGVKLLNKGPLVLHSELQSKPVITFTITCGYSTSNGTIDGQGETKQGQGKGTVTYEQCKVENSAALLCKVIEPIKTNQLKVHLAHITGTEEIVELFEPSPSQQTTEKIFTTLVIASTSGSSCTGLAGSFKIHGSVAGHVIPQEEEVTQGTLSFPEVAITSIKHEGQIVPIGLFAGPAPATFVGIYDAKLQKGDPFGAFQN